MSINARDEKDVYGGNYPKSRKLAIARSGGKCQFCGLRKASEGHHWAWPDYPSGEEVQGHDLTALCESCHALATVIRNWVERDGADFDLLAKRLGNTRTFFIQRKVFSEWLFPELDKQSMTSLRTHNASSPARNVSSLNRNATRQTITKPAAEHNRNPPKPESSPSLQPDEERWHWPTWLVWWFWIMVGIGVLLLIANSQTGD